MRYKVSSCTCGLLFLIKIVVSDENEKIEILEQFFVKLSREKVISNGVSATREFRLGKYRKYMSI